MRAQLAAALESVGFACPAAVLDKFTKYYRLILDYNRQTNLTTLTSPQDFIYKHIWDSLYPGNFCATPFLWWTWEPVQGSGCRSSWFSPTCR